MLLNELIAQMPAIELKGDSGTRIRALSHDSRRVESGFLFVAIKGEKSDGMRFLGQAIEHGAAAIASEHDPPPGLDIPPVKVCGARKFLAEAARNFYRDPTSQLQLAAITGTNGKTTTSYLLDSIFRQAGLRACLVETIGMKTQDPPSP